MLCAFLSLTFIYLLIVYSIRWFEYSNSNEYKEKYTDKTIFSDFQKEGYKALVGFILEYIYVIAHLVLLVVDYIVSLFQLITPKISSSQDNRNPIILVHGYMMRGLVMYPIKRRLSKDGYKNVYLFTYSPPWLNIDDFSRQLRDKIEFVKKETGAEKVDLICHSMGGLVALNYINNLDGAKSVNRLIALGTPFGGSKLWSFSIGRCGKEIKPGSEILKKLSVPPAGVKTTAIYTTFDEMVIPYEYSKIEGADNIEMNYIGHVGLLFDGKAYGIIREALKTFQSSQNSPLQM
ncbi:MAG: alpha/beta fold hydrolase [Nitrospinae bacterium]|nr:alpha/beta fold hydrolase [Nitrospinota bacterium]